MQILSTINVHLNTGPFASNRCRSLHTLNIYLPDINSNLHILKERNVHINSTLK